MITCVSCGGSFESKDIHQHHISYYPEKIINLCISCHRLVHNNLKIDRSKTFYDIKNGLQLTLKPEKKIPEKKIKDKKLK